MFLAKIQLTFLPPVLSYSPPCSLHFPSVPYTYTILPYPLYFSWPVPRTVLTPVPCNFSTPILYTQSLPTLFFALYSPWSYYFPHPFSWPFLAIFLSSANKALDLHVNFCLFVCLSVFPVFFFKRLIGWYTGFVVVSLLGALGLPITSSSTISTSTISSATPWRLLEGPTILSPR